MHVIVARLRVRPEHRAAFLKASEAIISGTRAESGCLFYALHEDAHDQNSFLFYEEWQDRAAIEAHFAEPHFLAFGAAIADAVIEKSIAIHAVAASEHP
jgi:quinol monooxygenase YgiN